MDPVDEICQIDPETFDIGHSCGIEVDRQQIVAIENLDAVSRIIEQCQICPCSLAQEFCDCTLGGPFVRFESFNHIELELCQAVRQAFGISPRVAQRRRLFVGGIADDESDTCIGTQRTCTGKQQYENSTDETEAAHQKKECGHPFHPSATTR